MTLTTIRKKQLVGITGFIMIGFLLAHLSGNFLIFKGPDALNDYAHFLRSLGPVLWIMRLGLLGSLIAHIGLTISLVRDNQAARGGKYDVELTHTESKNLAQRSMKYTGILIAAYLIVHLLDFTFAEHTGIVNGQDLGLYGLVVNTLGQPLHALLYILALTAVGFHLSHSIQSVCQTMGLATKSSLPKLQKISLVLGVAIALGYISIPLYILFVL